MPLMTQNAVVALKAESVEGTAETLTAAEAILVYNPVFTPGIERHERYPVRGDLSTMNRISGRRQATLSFSVEIKGSGAAGTPPEFGPALLGCKMEQTIDVGVSVAYAPCSSGDDSYTLALYEDGVCYTLWGARGTFTIDLNAGQAGMINFTFTGADFSVTDATLLSGMSYDSTVPPAFLSASLAVHGYSAICEALSLDIGNEVALRGSVNTGSGYLSAFIPKRMPKGSLDPEMVLVATEDFFGEWRSGTEGALTATIGATAGNICTITAPKLAYREVSLADRNSIRTLGINFDLNGNSGDDELVLTFT